MQLPAENKSRRLCLSQKEGSASTFPMNSGVFLEELPGYCAPTLKKLLHLRAMFETPLLHVFGFPFILRHQLSAAACCACCSSCCCCCFSTPVDNTSQCLTLQHWTLGTTANTAAVDNINSSCAAIKAMRTSLFDSTTVAIDAAGSTSNAPVKSDIAAAATATTEAARRDDAVELAHSCTSMIPCSVIRRCFCCKGIHNSSNDGGHIHHQTGESIRPVRRNKKRLRLVGEDSVAAVVVGAVNSCRRSSRTQDERAVEICITRSVLRQIKLPLEAGSYVLFFTEDWLQYLERYIRARQREALAFLSQCGCCPTCGGIDEIDYTVVGESSIAGSHSAGSGRSNNSSTQNKKSQISNSEFNKNKDNRGNRVAHVIRKDTICCRCEHVVERGTLDSHACWTCKTIAAGHTLYKKLSNHCDVCSSSSVADTHEHTTSAPLRFTPVLRQDTVQTEDSNRQCANNASQDSRKKFLLNFPRMLGQQLKYVLHSQVLNIHTQAHLDKRVVEEVLRNYLRAWRQRRRETIVFLKEVLHKAEKLLQEVSKTLRSHTEEKSHPYHQETACNEETFARNDFESSHKGEHGAARPVKLENTTVKMEHEESQISAIARENVEATHKYIGNSYISSNTIGSIHDNRLGHRMGPAHRQAGDGEATGICNDELLLRIKSETVSSPSTYTCLREQFKGDNDEFTMHKDVKEPQRGQWQQPVLKSARNSVLMKEVEIMQNFLQQGCEAAAEVFTLAEDFAAAAAFEVRNATQKEPGTGAQSYGEELQGTGDAHTADGRECTERQKKEHGRVVRIKQNKDEGAGLQAENKGAKENEEREENCRHKGKFGMGGPGPTRSPTAHDIVASLREKIRCTVAAMQLLTEGEKILSSEATIHPGLPDVAQEERCSFQRSSGLEASTANSTAPHNSNATALSTRAALAVTHISHGCKNRTNMQQPKTSKERSRNADNPLGHSVQPSVLFESPLQQQLEEILLLLYAPPLLCSRAGSNAVSLAVPQQGLLVRWLQDGRKEVLSSIRRRRFREVLWVDVERRGLLRSGLGSRMTLLDLKGIGEVESTQTAAGEVVKLAEKAEM